jgi:hypothetical protein
VGEDILLDEILIGTDFEGDEPGDDSKYILIVYGVGLLVYVYTQYTQLRALSAGKRLLGSTLVFCLTI